MPTYYTTSTLHRVQYNIYFNTSEDLSSEGIFLYESTLSTRELDKLNKEEFERASDELKDYWDSIDYLNPHHD